MEDINEEETSESSGSDGEGDSPEFVPSAWDKYALPVKSALRSPEKTNKVSFCSFILIIRLTQCLFVFLRSHKKSPRVFGLRNRSITAFMSIPESQKVPQFIVTTFGSHLQDIILWVSFHFMYLQEDS